MKPYFSVVIPARNEERYLAGALRALLAQDLPRRDFEIIVVDNGSTDKTAVVARTNGADLVLFEPRQGTNLARETGRAAAQGRIIACLDADCEPPPGWLRAISRMLSQDGTAAVSGPYDFGFTGMRKWADRFYAHFCFRQAYRFLPLIFRKPVGIANGGNFAAPAWVLEQIGGFPPRIFWGDDAATATAIARRVGPVRYDAALTVRSSPRSLQNGKLLSRVSRYIVSFFREYLSEETP